MSSTLEEVEPLYLKMAGDLEDIARDMLPSFESKESERNWSLAPKLRGGIPGPNEDTCRGNHRNDQLTADHCVQKWLPPGATYREGCRCRSGKYGPNNQKSTATNGYITVAAIMANITYNVRVGYQAYLSG